MRPAASRSLLQFDVRNDNSLLIRNSIPVSTAVANERRNGALEALGVLILRALRARASGLPLTAMNYDAFRRAWESALRTAGLLTHLDVAEESVVLATSSRQHELLLGVFNNALAEPFTAAMKVSWKWDALLAARARTSEDDLLTVLLGHGHVSPADTEKPWLRIDVEFRGMLAWDERLNLAGSETWLGWVAEVTAQVDPLLTPSEAELERDGLVRAWLGEPEAQVRCGPRGELWMLGVSLAAWQGIVLPRQTDDAAAADEGPERQLAAFAERLAKALAAWRHSLRMILTKSSIH